MPGNSKTKGSEAAKDGAKPTFSLSASKKVFDPTLASLFSTSAGPVKPAQKYVVPDHVSTKEEEKPKRKSKHVSEVEAPAAEDEEEDDEVLSSLDEDELDGIDDEQSDVEAAVTPAVEDQSSQRKRKRKSDDDNLEGAYMQRLAREEQKEQAKRRAESSAKRQKQTGEDDKENDEAQSGDEVDSDDMVSESDADDIPQHESLAGPKSNDELDKAARTVFLGNVSTEAITSKSAKKTLMNHLISFVSEIDAHKPPHKVESLRFRSTAFSSSVPKKAAFAKKELMDTTTKSTNAYAVYSDKIASREAARRLNGTVVLGRHLRVDEISHPAKTDHHRCVFVGNLGFVDDDSQMKAGDEYENRKPRKTAPGDVEEGLWQQFGQAGTVESVRVVRDPKTRVGKGFAYVQFTDQNAVEAALLYNDKKFPPLLPRKLRVVRAKKVLRNPKPSGGQDRGFRDNANGTKRRRPNSTAEQASLNGRASKLLGRAGAANLRASEREAANVKPLKTGEFAKGPTIRKPEDFVFEGHRASSKQGNTGLKLGRNGKKGKGRPKDRSAKRGAEWKRQGGRAD